MLQSLCYEIFSVPSKSRSKKKTTLANSNKNQATVQEIAVSFGQLMTADSIGGASRGWVCCLGDSEEMTANCTETLLLIANGSEFLQPVGYIRPPYRGAVCLSAGSATAQVLEESGSNNSMFSETLFTSVVVL